MKERHGSNESMQFASEELNGAMARNARNAPACHIATPGMKPSEMPGGNSKWHTSLVNNMPDGMNTRQNPMKRSLPERPAPATTPAPAPAQKKRRGMMTRGDAAGNVINLTRGHKNGLFQSAADVQSEQENDGQKHALAANKTSVDAKRWMQNPTQQQEQWGARAGGNPLRRICCSVTRREARETTAIRFFLENAL
jgi:hypothetical protein